VNGGALTFGRGLLSRYYAEHLALQRSCVTNGPAHPHTVANRRRYARVARLYDRLDGLFERWYRVGRARIGVEAVGLTLEVGAGTGKNFAYYRDQARVYASDLSPAMLGQARHKLQPPVRGLLAAEVTALPFRDGVADTVVATFVCCVQEDPRPALVELARVLKPGGQVLCLDYLLPERGPVRLVMRLLYPALHAIYGIHWEHDVPRLLAGAGLQLRELQPLWGPIVRYIAAEKPTA
jgi:phosphatidylethanolamine/phosphatidyl-N-methylethanolamine N-methyltransferase